jgi:hypothetical protein
VNIRGTGVETFLQPQLFAASEQFGQFFFGNYFGDAPF